MGQRVGPHERPPDAEGRRELKFYSNKVKMDTDLETNIAGLHCLGDSSGWTRGLMMASVMGVLMGRKLMEKHEF